MDNNAIGSKTITQIGIVVKDIEKSIRSYCSIFGVDRPKIIITGDYESAHTMFRGLPSTARAKLAFIEMGNLQIELIEPDGQPSTWQEHLDSNGESVHHLAFQTRDTDKVVADLARCNVPVAQQGDYTGGRYTYLDSAKILGVNLELLENFE
jgi:methylmalonyl-CoA/ethylmalonyl-CoA epimerase